MTEHPPKSRGDRYRIRWANVKVGVGRRFYTERRCIAERKTWLGWWPTRDSDWRREEESALADIEHAKATRQPLPAPKLVS